MGGLVQHGAMEVASEIWITPIKGIRLAGGTLREEAAGRAVLIIFLRHFGCLFCREMVKDLRALSASNPTFPRVLFFFQGSIEQGNTFFDRYWPEVSAVQDSSLEFYRAFDLRRGTLIELLGPQTWASGIRALFKGNFAGQSVGDPFVMPGIFLVKDENIFWSHAFKHAGDHPDFRAIAKMSEGAAV